MNQTSKNDSEPGPADLWVAWMTDGRSLHKPVGVFSSPVLARAACTGAGVFVVYPLKLNQFEGRDLNATMVVVMSGADTVPG